MGGWNLSYLSGRMEGEEPPWDFDAKCLSALGTACHVLDLGTGGGEQLLRFASALPVDTVATEGWAPNVPVAQANLAEINVAVVEYDAEAEPFAPMPFEDARFDLILNRHESFDADELYRVLTPGGLFLTQQVDGDDFAEAHEIFGAPFSYAEQTLNYVQQQLVSAGFSIDDADDWAGATRFYDVGALVYYFNLVPWDVPEDFSVDTYTDTLLQMHRKGPERGQTIDFTSRRFYVQANKPEAV